MLSEMLTNKTFAHVKQKCMTCIPNRYQRKKKYKGFNIYQSSIWQILNWYFNEDK